ncbi:MAG: phosphoribosyltransferase [Pseudomonadota bacterium]
MPADPVIVSGSQSDDARLTMVPETDPLACWQDQLPPDGPTGPVSETSFIARLPDQRRLLLPIRRLPDPPGRGLASLIINQASFAVENALCQALAARIAEHRPDIVVAVPTLGLIAGRGLAAALGHDRYVPLGTSRKFWYDEALSTDLSSITSPDQSKRLYLDPRLLPLLTGRRIALVDDVTSSGRSLAAALDLLARLDVEVTVIGTIMRQTDAWRGRLAEIAPQVPEKVVGVFDTPLLRWVEGRWETVDGSHGSSTDGG